LQWRQNGSFLNVWTAHQGWHRINIKAVEQFSVLTTGVMSAAGTTRTILALLVASRAQGRRTYRNAPDCPFDRDRA